MSFEHRPFIPYVQVRSKSLCLYDLPAEPLQYKRHALVHPTYSGTMTDHARSRILRTVDVFLQKSPQRKVFNPVIGQKVNFRLSFITLTISAQVCKDASDGHPALKVFLQHFKRPAAKKAISERLTSYIWKAELQERGQLHYHITTNAWLHWAEIQRVWNGIQFSRGWLNDFQARHGHTNPNSTDVHSVYKVRDIQAYLGKYLSKTGKKDVSELGFCVPVYVPSIGGKVWDCSQDLKVKRFSDELSSETEANILDAVAQGKAFLKRLDRCTMVNSETPSLLLSNQSHQSYLSWKI